jgi:orotate phosphoribosyltransferase-like protein
MRRTVAGELDVSTATLRYLLRQAATREQRSSRLLAAQFCAVNFP